MRLICAEDIKKRADCYPPSVRSVVANILSHTKTVKDAVKVVRCKDCIYYDAYLDGIEKYQWDVFCSDWARNTYEDWYCSRAERRTDE